MSSNWSGWSDIVVIGAIITGGVVVLGGITVAIIFIVRAIMKKNRNKIKLDSVTDNEK